MNSFGSPDTGPVPPPPPPTPSPAVGGLVGGAVENGMPQGAATDVAGQASDRLPEGDGDPTSELGPYFDAAALQRRLGFTMQELNAQVHRNTLLGVETDEGSVLYPMWQFHPDMTVLEGLPQLLRILHQTAPDGFSKAAWLAAPQARFGGRSAAGLLAEGAERGPLLAAARADVERLSH